MWGLGAAIGFLTAVRLPGARTAQPVPVSRWLGWTPLVGLGLGMVAGFVLGVLRLLSTDSYQQLLASAGMVGFLALLTRGLHLDGLADTADGLGARDREGALRAMRDPAVGSFGVSALVLVLVVQVSALWQAITLERGTITAVTAVATGRLALLWGCRRGVPSARADGLGAAGAGSVPLPTALIGSGVVLVACCAGGAVDDHQLGAGAEQVALAVLAGLAAAYALRRRAVRRLGGVTGDVLGAMVEVATTAAIVVMAWSR